MFRKQIAVDLGTANTLVYVPSRGIVIDEPSVVAIDTVQDRIIAIGSSAKEYIGKTPQRIRTIRPPARRSHRRFRYSPGAHRLFSAQGHRRLGTDEARRGHLRSDPDHGSGAQSSSGSSHAGGSRG